MPAFPGAGQWLTVRHDDRRLARVPRTDSAERAACAAASSRGGGLRRRDVVGPLLAVERAAGRVRVRLVVARRRAGGDDAAVRRGERARAAIPPGHHRPGDRHARGDVPRAVLGRRSAPERPPTSTSPGTAGRDKDDRDRRLVECVEVIRALFAGEEVTHHGLVEVDRARLWTLPGEPPPADRRGGVRRDRGARSAAWADGLDHRQPGPSEAPAGPRRLSSRGGRGKAGLSPGARVVGGDRRGGPGHRPRPVADERVRPAGVLGPRADRRTSTRPPATSGPRTSPTRARVRGSALAPRPACRPRRARASTGCGSTTSASSRPRSSRPSASTSCPRCGWQGERREHRRHLRPVVEERRHLLPRRADVRRLQRRRHR